MSETTKQLKGEEYLVTHTVGPNRSGFRLDRFLMERYKRRSREQLKKAIDSGAITVLRTNLGNAQHGRMKPSYLLNTGDTVQVLSVRRPEPAVNFGYYPLFEDEEIIVIHKPPNLPVHPAGRFFFNTLLVHLKTNGFTSSLESERRYYLVHRIDKETSGVLLLAKTKEACAALTLQFANRETDKYYLALVHGKPEQEEFEVSQAIGKIPSSRIGLKMYPRTLEEGGLPSLTRFERVETRTGSKGTFSLMACFPRTGRQHQIRVHADVAGIPLVGDKLYGMPDDDVYALLESHRGDGPSLASPEPAIDSLEDEYSLENDLNEPLGSEEEVFEIPGPTVSLYPELEARLILPRHALHAAGLRFKHPRTGKEMVFEAPLPDDLREFFEDLSHTKLEPFRTGHW